MSIFEREREMEGHSAPGVISRRLRALKISSGVSAVREALDSEGIAYESPGWRGHGVAHIVIPDAKLAIQVRAAYNDSERRKIRSEWEREGYKVSCITDSSVLLSKEEGNLKSSLMDYLSSLGLKTGKKRTRR